MVFNRFYILFSHFVIGMDRFDVVLEENVDGGFVALVPRIPGCISEGETCAEALDNVKDAIKAMLSVLKEDNIALTDYSPFNRFEIGKVAV